MRHYRLEKGQTQKQVADAVQISPLAVLRYEQFIYEELSMKLASYYADLMGIPVSEVLATYRHERRLHQLAAEAYFNKLPSLTIITNEHPFVTFRKTITQRAVGKDSRMSFCNLLAVHPSVVADYELGKFKHLPNLIKEALSFLDPNYLQSLDDLGAIWYERRN